MTQNEMITRRLEELIIEKTLLKMKVEQLENQLKSANKMLFVTNIDANLINLN